MDAETCASCMWARELPPEMRVPPGVVIAEAIRCVRFPQAVVNSPDYVCGEWLKKKG